MRLPRHLLLLFPLVLPPGARALDWPKRTVEVRPAPFQDLLTLIFEFKNSGSKPVTIRSVQTSCHCISAAPDKSTYAPGETGRIIAEFSIGDRYGLYERQISVASDDTDSPQILTAKVEVPDVATIMPRMLEWHLGATATEQSVELRAAAGLTIDFSEAVSTSEVFHVRLEPVDAGHVYRLFVQPGSTAAVANAAIRLHGKDRTGHEVLISAYANVR